MRLITTFELATRHVTELHVLFRVVAESDGKKGAPNVSQTLANIKAAIGLYTMKL